MYKPCAQLDTSLNDPRYSCESALDGIDQTWSATKWEFGSWWMVDLLDSFSVYHILLVNKPASALQRSRMNNLSISSSDEQWARPDSMAGSWSEITFINDTNGEDYIFINFKPIEMRLIAITNKNTFLPSYSQLFFREVIIHRALSVDNDKISGVETLLDESCDNLFELSTPYDYSRSVMVLDLQTEYIVDSVKLMLSKEGIWNGQSGISVFVTREHSRDLCYEISELSYSPYHRECTERLTGRFVRVVTLNPPLLLCSIDVYGSRPKYIDAQMCPELPYVENGRFECIQTPSSPSEILQSTLICDDGYRVTDQPRMLCQSWDGFLPYWSTTSCTEGNNWLELTRGGTEIDAYTQQDSDVVDSTATYHNDISILTDGISFDYPVQFYNQLIQIITIDLRDEGTTVHRVIIFAQLMDRLMVEVNNISDPHAPQTCYEVLDRFCIKHDALCDTPVTGRYTTINRLSFDVSQDITEVKIYGTATRCAHPALYQEGLRGTCSEYCQSERSYFNVGEALTIECDNQYYQSRWFDKTITCLSSGYWSESYCTEYPCPLVPVAINGGYVKCDQPSPYEIEYRSGIMLVCDEGFVLNRSNAFFCYHESRVTGQEDYWSSDIYHTGCISAPSCPSVMIREMISSTGINREVNLRSTSDSLCSHPFTNPGSVSAQSVRYIRLTLSYSSLIHRVRLEASQYAEGNKGLKISIAHADIYSSPSKDSICYTVSHVCGFTSHYDQLCHRNSDSMINGRVSIIGRYVDITQLPSNNNPISLCSVEAYGERICDIRSQTLHAGSFTQTNKTLYNHGQTIGYSCLPGYDSNRSLTHELICRNGVFVADNYHCKKPVCGEPPFQPNALVHTRCLRSTDLTFDVEYKPGTGCADFDDDSYSTLFERVLYECVTGYSMFGDPHAACLVNHEYSIEGECYQKTDWITKFTCQPTNRGHSNLAVDKRSWNSGINPSDYHLSDSLNDGNSLTFVHIINTRSTVKWWITELSFWGNVTVYRVVLHTPSNDEVVDGGLVTAITNEPKLDNVRDSMCYYIKDKFCGKYDRFCTKVMSGRYLTIYKDSTSNQPLILSEVEALGHVSECTIPDIIGISHDSHRYALRYRNSLMLQCPPQHIELVCNSDGFVSMNQTCYVSTDVPEPPSNAGTNIAVLPIPLDTCGVVLIECLQGQVSNGDPHIICLLNGSSPVWQSTSTCRDLIFSDDGSMDSDLIRPIGIEYITKHPLGAGSPVYDEDNTRCSNEFSYSTAADPSSDAHYFVIRLTSRYSTVTRVRLTNSAKNPFSMYPHSRYLTVTRARLTTNANNSFITHSHESFYDRIDSPSSAELT